MTYLKSVLAGLAAVAVAITLNLVIVAAVVTTEFIRPSEIAAGDQYLGSRSFITVNVPLSLILAAVAFMAGFWWEYRRASRSRRLS